MTNKEKDSLKDEQLNKVTDGKSLPHEPENNTDEAILENLQDNKGADE